MRHWPACTAFYSPGVRSGTACEPDACHLFRNVTLQHIASLARGGLTPFALGPAVHKLTGATGPAHAGLRERPRLSALVESDLDPAVALALILDLGH